jgi:hypothetical protein
MEILVFYSLGPIHPTVTLILNVNEFFYIMPLMGEIESTRYVGLHGLEIFAKHLSEVECMNMV